MIDANEILRTILLSVQLIHPADNTCFGQVLTGDVDSFSPTGICLFKFDIDNTKLICKICSKLIKDT